MNNLFASRKTLVLIICLLFLVFFVLIYSLFFKPTQNSTPTSSPVPSPTTNSGYNNDQVNQDFSRLKNPKPLSTADANIRQKFITSIGNKSGILVTTSAFSIQYVATANQFLVEIDDTNADQAKKASEKWFTDQGLSQQGICNLPAVYYLGGNALVDYRKNGKQFNPIPDGC